MRTNHEGYSRAPTNPLPCAAVVAIRGLACPLPRLHTRPCALDGLAAAHARAHVIDPRLDRLSPRAQRDLAPPPPPPAEAHSIGEGPDWPPLVAALPPRSRRHRHASSGARRPTPPRSQTCEGRAASAAARAAAGERRAPHACVPGRPRFALRVIAGPAPVDIDSRDREMEGRAAEECATRLPSGALFACARERLVVA
jgi:hypothetical protein